MYVVCTLVSWVFGRIQFLVMLAKFQPSGSQKISSIWWLVNIIWNTDPSVHFILVVYALVGQVFRHDLIFGNVGQIVATWWWKKGIFGVFQPLSGILITQPLHMWYMHWLGESSESILFLAMVKFQPSVGRKMAIHGSIIHFRLRCCRCPILWGWHQS